MLKEVLYATSNPGKVTEVSKLLNFNSIKVITPKDLKIEIKVEETGRTLEENARLKAEAYLGIVKDRLVLSDDSGCEIDALNGEPGIYTRRWRDHKTEMSDDEIINYCIELMKEVPKDKRGAQFKTVLALGIPGQGIEIFTGSLKGEIVTTPSSIKVLGFPFESLFYVTEWKKMMGEVHLMPVAAKGKLLNHRERALQKAIPRIIELLG